MRHRLRIAGATSEIFSGGALREVHRLSGGVPRVINIICDRALLGAYTEDHHHVSSALVRRAASEIFGERLAPPWLTPLIATALPAGGRGRRAVLWRQAALTRAGAAAAAPHAMPHGPGSARRPGAARARRPTLAQLFASAGDSHLVRYRLCRAVPALECRYQPGPTDPCTQAETQGLYCVTLHSSLAQLREFGRPAILMLGEGGVASPTRWC